MKALTSSSRCHLMGSIYPSPPLSGQEDSQSFEENNGPISTEDGVVPTEGQVGRPFKNGFLGGVRGID